MNSLGTVCVPGNRKKRGRRSRDVIDDDIKSSRARLRRGIPHLVDHLGKEAIQDMMIDELVLRTLEREKQIVRNKELVEIREIPVDEELASFGGSPVTTRLAIHVNSISKTLSNAFKQISLIPGNQLPDISFTPEAFILMSKACEQFIIELTVRAHIFAILSGSPHFLSASHISNAVRSAWRSNSDFASTGSFDFLTDVIERRADNPVDMLEIIAKIHKNV